MDRRRRQLTISRLGGAILLAMTAAAPASGQDWRERVWVTANGGVQTSGSSFSDTVDIQQYAETGTVKTDYPSKAGAVVDGSVGVRLWKGFGAGVALTRTSYRTSAPVDARIPHPFFDNQFRTVQGSTSVARTETGAHIQLSYLARLGDRLRMIVSGGPSRISVEQTVVTDVQYAQEYPYDTATFTGATTRRASKAGTGFNIGADAFWMLGRTLGAGGGVRFTRATVRENVTTTHTVSLDAGGVQAGAGIRLVF